MTEQERCRYQRRYGLKERQQGRVKTINAERGYMFIAGDDGADVFAHRSQVPKFEVMARSDLVSYITGVSRKDPTRSAAYDVRLVGAATSTERVQESDTDGPGRFLRDDHKVS
jgi:cold shock CspA family protein